MAVLDSNPGEQRGSPAGEGRNEQAEIRVDSGGLNVKVRDVPLYSGSIHYWRHLPDAWPTLLERIKGLGFDIIQTPVPWGVHETGPGIFDFGATNPRKDLSKFLDLCRKAGLSAILGVGPCVDEDLPYGGFPQRIIGNSALWALTSTGAPALARQTNPPCPIPSFANEKFFAEAAKFFDALAPVIKPRQNPKGAVVLCTVNIEAAFSGRRGGETQDYSADSISLYRKFLSEKYSSVEALNGAYGKNYSSFSEIQPPRSINPADMREALYYLDWMEFGEYLIRRALQRFTQMLRERELAVPLAIDGPLDILTPTDSTAWQGIPEISLCGIEVDPARQEYAELARNVRYLAGTRKLAWVSTFGCGASWISPRIPTPEEEEFAILAAIMHGMSGVNFHLLAEGDRWVGAPIKREGAYRDEYADLFRRLNDFISQYQVWSSKKVARALVLLPYGLERYRRLFSTMNQAYLGLLHVPAMFSEMPSSPVLLTESARQSVLEENNWVSEIFQALEQAQVEYNLSDTHAPPDAWNEYGMIFLPTADFLDSTEQEKILSFVERGGHLVVGPALLTLEPASALTKLCQAPEPQVYGAGKIIPLQAVNAESINGILRPGMKSSLVLDNPKVRLTIREGTPTLFFLANPTDEVQKTSLASPWPVRCLWNAPENTQGENVTTELKPFTIQVWEAVP